MPKANTVLGLADMRTLNFAVHYATLLEKTGRVAAAAPVRRDLLAGYRQRVPADDPRLAAELAAAGAGLLRAGKPADAEPLLWECLAIRMRRDRDGWPTHNTVSALGGCLLAQRRHDEAEPLLLAGYRGLAERAATIPPQARDRPVEAIDRLIELYLARGKPDEVARWRTERNRYREQAPPPRPAPRG